MAFSVVAVVPCTTAEVLVAQDRAFQRLSSLARSVDESILVANTEWTVRQLLAHLLGTARRYADAKANEMASSARDVDAINARDVVELATEPVDELLTELEVAHDRLQEAQRDREGDRIPFHAGLTISPTASAGEWLGELLIHGRDLAMGSRRSWPISNADALMIAAFTFEVLPGYLDTARIRSPLHVVVKLRHGIPQAVSIHEDQVSVRDGHHASHAHAVIAATAPAWVLLGYGRTNLLGAMRRGLAVVGGRRPWRAFEFQRSAIAP